METLKKKETYLKFDCNPLDRIHITQGFGEDPSYYARYGLLGHNGLDLRTKFEDTPLGRREVRAVWPGVVLQALRGHRVMGNYVRLSHEGGRETVYLHLSKLLVKKGEKVEAGKILGFSGNTGESQGAHLHFGYRPPAYDKEDGYLGYIDPKFLLV